MDLRKEIYVKMSGQFVDDVVVKAGNYLVEDEFAGIKCEELYERAYAANKRLCKRLNGEEEEDVEIIFDSLFEIGEIMAMRMFDYGVMCAQTARGNGGDNRCTNKMRRTGKLVSSNFISENS